MTITMVRVVSAPITLMKDWPECRHSVFYLFQAIFHIRWLSLQWILVIGCFVLFQPTFWFGWHALAEGFCAKGFFIIRLAFCGLCSFAHLLFLLLSVGALCFFFFFSFCFCLLKWPLFSAWASVNHSFFTPWCFFFPCFPLCYSLLSAMHLGNQEMDSDAEDEVNHTLPTMCCPLR